MSSVHDKKILVLGVSRGGTTLLCSAIGAHPQVAMLDEDMNDGINKITGGKIPANKLCVPNQIEMSRTWSNLYRLGKINGFFRKSFFMCKIPNGRYSIDDYQNFGDIHHVCILRHPAGVLKSIQKRENRSLKNASYRWQRCLQIFKELADSPNRKTIFVSFENLVAEPERVLKTLATELGIDYTDAMLNAPSKNDRYKTSKGFQKDKSNYDFDETIWHNFDEGTKALYEEINNLCI